MSTRHIPARTAESEFIRSSASTVVHANILGARHSNTVTDAFMFNTFTAYSQFEPSRSLPQIFEVIIEGTDGDDWLEHYGSGSAYLIGRAGDDNFGLSPAGDLVDGGEGVDTYYHGGGFPLHGRSALTWEIQDLGTMILVDGYGNRDTLVSIERLAFTDGTISREDGDPLFDTIFYNLKNSDIWQAKVDAKMHYADYGWREGRDPNPYFDTVGYLAANKDVVAAGLNPLEHYRTYGWREGRDPSPDFDTSLYLKLNPDVAAVGMNPLDHWLSYGRAEARQSGPAIGEKIVDLVDGDYYLLSNPDVAAAGVDAAVHFAQFGWREGRDPNGYFDTSGYLGAYGDVAAAGINPLEHYNAHGWREGRDPSRIFDTDNYLAANADVVATGLNPLGHWLEYGAAEGRILLGDDIWV